MRRLRTPDEASSVLNWRDLSEETREGLGRKLEGLYGQGSDQNAFDALATDKQQALLILFRRLQELKLWHAVRRVENVYGMGGVGMDFAAWPLILSTLRRRSDFTRRFANHHDTTGGFIERGTGSPRASLHILYVEQENGARRWAAHFDLHHPWASPRSAWRHFVHEKLKGLTPDWRVISASLWSSPGDSRPRIKRGPELY